MHDSDSPLSRISDYLSSMAEDDLSRLPEYYSTDIHFTDPINNARGLPHLTAVFEDLFKQLKNLSFKPLQHSGDSTRGFLLWEMRYTFRGKARTLQGTSYFEFDDKGKVSRQWDHWDAGVGVYKEFPLLGATISGIQKLVRVNAPSS